MDRDSAQARLNRIHAFNAELASLEGEGVATLDERQRAAIASHHQRLVADLTSQFDLDLDESQRRMSIGMRIASVLGAIALSAAVFLAFYRIWGRLSTPIQIALLTCAPLAAVGLTELAHRFDRSRHLVFVAAAIACASIVMNVALVGDIFAMTSSPNALAVWALFTVLAGYAYGLRLPVAVGLGLAIAFAAGAALAWQGLDWHHFGQRPELLLLPAAVVGVASTVVAMRFASTYRLVGGFVLLAALWVLAIDAGTSVLVWDATLVRAMYQVIGFMASAGLIALGLSKDWNETSMLGAAGFVVFLNTKFYQWWWDWMPAYLFFFIVGAAAVAMILVLRRLRAATAAEAS